MSSLSVEHFDLLLSPSAIGKSKACRAGRARRTGHKGAGILSILGAGFLGDKNSLWWRENIGEMALYIKGKVSTTYSVLGSSVEGLYAGGDELQGASLGGAAVFGWIAGGNAASYARGAETPSIDKVKATLKPE